MNTQAIRQRYIRSHMIAGKTYSFIQLYMMHQEMMSLDEFIELPDLKENSLRDNLTKWSSVEGGWLCKMGSGKQAIYWKRHPPNIVELIANSWNELKQKVRAYVSSIKR